MGISSTGGISAEQMQGAAYQRPAEMPQEETQDAAALKQAQAATNTGATQVTQTTTDEDDTAYQTIVQKADSGQTLTSSELSQLRAKDPTRYNKAVKAQQARQDLRSQMESDPSHASLAAREAIAAIKTQDAATLAGAHGTAEGASSLVSALNDEYTSFARQYDQVMFGSAASSNNAITDQE